MKIKSIKISHFRGIPNTQNVDFTDNLGFPVSTIIYGDNGCGKSSIIDALEFNLQGLIEHSSTIINPLRPSAISFYRQNENDTPVSSIELEDGTLFERNIIRKVEIRETLEGEEELEKFFMSPTAPFIGYNISSFVLRRNDLYRFTSTPDEQKQVLLWKYFFVKASKDLKSTGDVEKTIIRERYVELKHRRREYIKSLAEELGLKPEQIPVDPQSFNNFVANSGKFYKQRSFYPKNSIAQRTNFTIPAQFKATHELEILIKSVNKEIGNMNKQIAEQKKPAQSIPVSINPYLNKASEYLSKAFLQISNTDFISSIEIHIGAQSATSLSLKVILKNGIKTTPQKIFSEANQDLLILLLYISIFRVAQEYGQSKVIVLDDVLQSIDASIRTKFMEYLLTELKDNQFILTVHDKLWLNQLRVMFQRHSHKIKEYHIVNWNFEMGPNLLEMNFSKGDDSLTKALQTNNSFIIASVAGVFLERICQKLSIHLSIALHRKADDKYTLGELWPGIYKILKKTSLKDCVESLNQLLFIRNFIGCHYNEWAESLSDKEIREFALCVQKLYEDVFCVECCSWVTKFDKNYMCNCNKISL